MKEIELINKCKKADKVYLYGCGKIGKRAFAYLKNKGIEIEAFLQTQVSTESSFHGKKILNIDDISVDRNALIVVCVGEKAIKEVFQELEKRNYLENSAYILDYAKEDLEKLDYSTVRPSLTKEQTMVLLFHRVAYKENDPWELEINPDLFDEYIRMISENYNVLRFEDDWTKAEEPSIVITFDDGYMDNYKYALPILEKYRVPATIFVSTGNIDSDNEFWWDRLTRFVSEEEVKSTRDMLKVLLPEDREKALQRIENERKAHTSKYAEDRSVSTEELKKLGQSEYITIGGHTVTHTALSAEDIDKQRWEIKTSREIIENAIGRRITTFSYPFGQRDTYTDDTIRILKEERFDKAASNFAGISRINTNQYEIPRIALSEKTVRLGKKGLEELWYFYGG